MIVPKQSGKYLDRNLDCQTAISPGILDLIEQATLTGGSGTETAAAISGKNVPGIQNLINDAVKAGWSADEAARTITEVAQGMRVGSAGIDQNE